MSLSIIVPLHNEERRLPAALPKLLAYTTGSDEIILVENGSTDATLDAALAYASQHERIRVIQVHGRGKGLAVRAGMLHSRGDLCLMADVDLSMPLGQAARLLSAVSAGADVAIASREAPGAQVATSPRRRIMGRAFHAVAGILAPGIRDTQCGFKLFTARAAIEIFRRLTVTGMAFDVQALYLARRLGLRVDEIPVQWSHDPDSRVRLVGDSLSMLAELASIPLQDYRKAPEYFLERR